MSCCQINTHLIIHCICKLFAIIIYAVLPPFQFRQGAIKGLPVPPALMSRKEFQFRYVIKEMDGNTCFAQKVV